MTALDFEHPCAIPKHISPAQVIHVEANAYAVVDVNAAKDKARLLSSTGFCECMGILACVKDTQGKPLRWALAHLTIDNDADSTIRQMLGEASAGIPNSSIEIDLVGGYRNKSTSDSENAREFRRRSEVLYKTALETLASMPTISIKNNKMFDSAYASEITVDLLTGKKYSGHLDYDKSDIAQELMDLAAKRSDGACKQFKSRTPCFKQREEGITPPAAKFEWENCLPEMAQIWKTDKHKIHSRLYNEWNR